MQDEEHLPIPSPAESSPAAGLADGALPVYGDWAFSPQIDKLAAALAKAHTKVANPGADAQVDYQTKSGRMKYRYATLASVLDAVRVPFAENGLVLTQMVTADGPLVRIHTLLLHSSGQWQRCCFTVRPV